MQNKIKTLEKLVFDACKKLKQLEKENASLSLQARGMARELEKLQYNHAQMRKLKEWKDGIRQKLKKLSVKIEHAIEKAEKSARHAPDAHQGGAQ